MAEKIKPPQIAVGRFYVSKTELFVREIVQEANQANIYWRDYELATGEPIATNLNLCSKRSLAQWAGREATPDEVKLMQQQASTNRERERIQQVINTTLHEASDEDLLAEIRRRGLRREDVLQALSHID